MNFLDYNKITVKRRTVQALFLFLYFIFPLFSIFYLNLNSRAFVLFGKTIGINNSVIFVIGSITVLMGVVTMAVTTGRTFCGWVCPQNFLSEMINLIIKKFALDNNGKKKIMPYSIIIFLSLVISVLVAINFMFFFGKPSDIIEPLKNGEFNGTLTIFAIFFGLIVFAGIGIFRHDFCKYACPYGIMQAAVGDKSTLRVRFEKERSSDCINCEACTDICYVKTEPRKLIQPDPGCMNCGLCVEACHNVLAPTGVKTMLSFSMEKSVKENLNNKTSIIFISTLVLSGLIFIFMFFSLPVIDLTVTRNDLHVSKIDNDGFLSSKYFVSLLNQTSEKQDVKLSIEGINPDYALFEKKAISLESGEETKFDLTINAKKTDLKPGIIKFYIIVQNGKKVLNKVRASLFVPF